MLQRHGKMIIFYLLPSLVQITLDLSCGKNIFCFLVKEHMIDGLQG